MRFGSVGIAHFAAFVCLLRFASAAQPEPAAQVPILVYHRFGQTVTDSMTVSVRVFESQLALIHQGGYHVIALQDLVDAILNKGELPSHSIVITADDGHESIYSEMVPRLKRYGFPATLFIYPSAISNAKWAMTWPQLVELQASGLFDVQSHTYWHPNFRIEKQRLTATAYQEFVDWQLERSKKTLEQTLKKRIDLLAWPFGIYDDWLMEEARQAGYRAAFSIERRPARIADLPMALPRYLMTDSLRGSSFEKLLEVSR